MKLYIQWARETPSDWELLDVTSGTQIRRLPKRGVPGAGSAVDGQPGWVSALNCQGITFDGYDHIAIEHLAGSDTLVITGWVDDPDDNPDDFRFAVQWRLSPPAPDPTIGGAMNTVQALTVWGTPGVAGPPDMRPWEEFVPPPADVTLHGIWLSEANWRAHRAAQSPHRWREWLP